MRLMRPILITLIAVTVSACSNTGLRHLQNLGDGPDDFLVNPSKPLQQPESYTTLPAPTVGRANRADATPVADGIAALGGQVGDPNGSIPGVDGAVVQHASRFGVEQNVRVSLAAEDEKFRKRRGRFSQIRIVPTDSYNEVYKKSALDAEKVALQYRRAGVATPSAPPSN